MYFVVGAKLKLDHVETLKPEIRDCLEFRDDDLRETVGHHTIALIFGSHLYLYLIKKEVLHSCGC